MFPSQGSSVSSVRPEFWHISEKAVVILLSFSTWYGGRS